MCNRPTKTVLATKDSVDFFYVCDGHLSDQGFASLFVDSGSTPGAQKPALSEEEIQKVKEEYEARQKKRKEKEEGEKKEKEKEKDGAAKDEKKDNIGNNEKEKGAEDNKVSATVQSPPPSGGSSPPPTVAHQRYTLHREIFAMRLDIHKKRRQTAQAKNIAPRLPSAPRGNLG